MREKIEIFGFDILELTGRFDRHLSRYVVFSQDVEYVVKILVSVKMYIELNQC